LHDKAAGEGVEARTALAIAATYVVGFRAAHGLESLGALTDEADDDTSVDTDVTALAKNARRDPTIARRLVAGTAKVRALVTGNVLSRLHEGASQQSVLAIGMQTTGTATVDARVSDNTETYIGNGLIGDIGFADSEGLFANSAGRSRLTEHVDANTFDHGLGHLSANCFEVVSSSGGPTMDGTTAATCRVTPATWVSARTVYAPRRWLCVTEEARLPRPLRMQLPSRRRRRSRAPRLRRRRTRTSRCRTLQRWRRARSLAASRRRRSSSSRQLTPPHHHHRMSQHSHHLLK